MNKLEFFDSSKATLAELEQTLGTEPEFVHLRDTRGETALFLAIEHGSEFVSLLLAAGADANSRNHAGETPLHQAAEDYDQHAAQLLIDCGANVNAPDHLGQTPLHAAAHCGAYQVAEVLIHNGAAVNCRDTRGYTPLHCAVFDFFVWCLDDHLKLTEILLRAGADPNIPANSHATALDLAERSFDNQAIVTLLLQYGAKRGA